MNLNLLEVPLPIRFRPDTPMTDDELQRLCEFNDILWIERDASGWIHVRPIAGCRVASAEVAVCAALSRWTDEDGRGKAFLCAGFILPDSSMFGCSLAWMLNERWQSLTREEQASFAPRCPDFVIEILSPFDKLAELEAKMELWIANGAQIGWLIDLDREAVQIYRPNKPVEVVARPSSVQGTGPVAGFDLVMARVWGSPRSLLEYTLPMNLAFSEEQSPFRIRFAQPITGDELERFCAENDPLRIELDSNGELIVMTPTNSEEGGIESDALLELGNWARADGRGKFFGSNTGFTLPDSSVRAADAAWVSWRRWNALTAKQRKSYAPICPEFVIEIRSDSDRLAELQAKMEMWIANGAEVAWLIDPQRKAVEIYRPGDSPEVLQEPSSVQGTGPVAGFELVMARVWQ